jgi:hypothetical protein
LFRISGAAPISSRICRSQITLFTAAVPRTTRRRSLLVRVRLRGLVVALQVVTNASVFVLNQVGRAITEHNLLTPYLHSG